MAGSRWAVIGEKGSVNDHVCLDWGGIEGREKETKGESMHLGRFQKMGGCVM